MTSEQLRKMIRATPFEPFRMFLADGRELRVQHPEMVAVSSTGRTAIVMLPDAEDYEVVDLLLVTGLRRANGTGAGDAGTAPGRAE